MAMAKTRSRTMAKTRFEDTAQSSDESYWCADLRCKRNTTEERCPILTSIWQRQQSRTRSCMHTDFTHCLALTVACVNLVCNDSCVCLRVGVLHDGTGITGQKQLQAFAYGRSLHVNVHRPIWGCDGALPDPHDQG